MNFRRFHIEFFHKYCVKLKPHHTKQQFQCFSYLSNRNRFGLYIGQPRNSNHFSLNCVCYCSLHLFAVQPTIQQKKKKKLYIVCTYSIQICRCGRNAWKFLLCENCVCESRNLTIILLVFFFFYLYVVRARFKFDRQNEISLLYWFCRFFSFEIQFLYRHFSFLLFVCWIQNSVDSFFFFLSIIWS